MAAYDFKKEFKDLYQPKKEPSPIVAGPMKFIAVEGKGDPNEEGGEYQKAIEILYSLSYTIKMSHMSDHRIDGYFEYVVPPLEGLWNHESFGIDVDKTGFEWTSMIRQPDFVDRNVFEWACGEVVRKKGLDPSCAKLITYDEGPCVQCLHVGPYDDEPETIGRMVAYIGDNGFERDSSRKHHEIYLSDPRRTATEKLKTVIRIPVRQNTLI